MDFQRDFAELCSLLNAKSVDFPIVGGYAVAFHGAPRFTGDLDILISPDSCQIECVLSALCEFGFPANEVIVGELLEQHRILQLGRPPGQVHVMTNISGVNWDRAWASRERGNYGDVPVYFIGREVLLANKRAAGRIKDLADVEALEKRRK
ncbi:MAG TPA: hypothetical protein VIX89_09695 [Bryobacteraceae bacterium]